MILVYTHKITPRLRYVFKHIFTRVLQITVDFTTKIEEFIAFNGLKMTYSKAPLGNEFFIRNNDLLFEQGVNDLDINIFHWEEIPCFFNAGSKSVIPFDIFAASFYLLSRYEEYLPHVRDVHERFTAEQSLAFKYRFLEKPLVDVWAYKLLEKLKEKFPDYTYKTRTYQYVSTIDIDNAFAYKHKSLVRTFGAFIKDFFSFKLRNFWDRFAVIANIKKDPYNTFELILRLKKQYKINPPFFF